MPKKRRRRLYRYHLGSTGGYQWSPAKLRDILRKQGFKVKIVGTNLVGISRVAVDGGFMLYETLDSLAGHTYNALTKIDLYAYPEDIELVEIIIRGCYFDILPNEDEINQFKEEAAVNAIKELGLEDEYAYEVHNANEEKDDATE